LHVHGQRKIAVLGAKTLRKDETEIEKLNNVLLDFFFRAGAHAHDMQAGLNRPLLCDCGAVPGSL
jgi:hypothetical protein